MINAFLGCQFFVVLFMALHDWIPLGRLNDLEGIRAADTRGKLIMVTTLSTLPFAIALVASVYYARLGLPMWLMWLLWISYGTGLYGMLQKLVGAILLPSKTLPAPRAIRFDLLGRTHSFRHATGSGRIRSM